MTKTNDGRIRYIDALRGVTMLLVVFGHAMMSIGLGGYDSVLSSVILTFRMPMFFFISGFIAYKAVDFWGFSFLKERLRKKALVQIIPALFFFSVYTLCNGGNPTSFVEYGFGGYWFTFVLFEMFCIYFVLSLIGHCASGKIVDIGMILLSVVGVLCLLFLRNDSRLWTVLCLENLTKYFQYFAFGILCKKYSKAFFSAISNEAFKAATIIMFIICLLLYFNESLRTSYPLTYAGIHDVFVRYFGILTIFAFFFTNKDFFDKENRVNKIYSL